MSQATARTAVYNAVNGVTNKGVCYDYERWAADWGQFLTLFKTTVSATDQIRGWEVAYRGLLIDTQQRAFGKSTMSIHRRVHRFQVKGYMGVDDSAGTEKTFAALAEAVIDALDGAAALHAASSDFLGTSPASIDTFEPRIFGDTLCHYAEINLTISEMSDA